MNVLCFPIAEFIVVVAYALQKFISFPQTLIWALHLDRPAQIVQWSNHLGAMCSRV